MARLGNSKIFARLKKAKQEQLLAAEAIRIIAKSAISQSVAKTAASKEEDPQIIDAAVRETITAVLEVFPPQVESVDVIATAITGVVEGMSCSKLSAIAKVKRQISQLQAQVDQEEQMLRAQIEHVLGEIRLTAQPLTAPRKQAIEQALSHLTLHQVLSNQEQSLYEVSLGPSELN